jgi:hypothetical protein
MSYNDMLRNIQEELEQPIKDGVILDPDGEGTVYLPIALYFQILGLIISLLHGEKSDGDKPS